MTAMEESSTLYMQHLHHGELLKVTADNITPTWLVWKLKAYTGYKERRQLQRLDRVV